MCHRGLVPLWVVLLLLMTLIPTAQSRRGGSRGGSRGGARGGARGRAGGKGKGGTWRGIKGGSLGGVRGVALGGAKGVATGGWLGSQLKGLPSHILPKMGSTNQGLRVGGAVAAGGMGTVALGYGLEALGESRLHRGFDMDSSKKDPTLLDGHGIGLWNQSILPVFFPGHFHHGASDPGPTSTTAVIITGLVFSVLLGTWIRT